MKTKKYSEEFEKHCIKAKEMNILADEVTEIEEEETPLAVPVDNCMIHWLILILTAAYAVYEIVRGFARKKKSTCKK